VKNLLGWRGRNRATRMKRKLRLRHLLVCIAWLGVNLALIHSILSREESASSAAVLDAIVFACWFLIANAIALGLVVLIFADDLLD
jgi:hypothetical protein